jgi:hypothetical protein
VLDTASGRKLWGAKIGRGDFQALSLAGDGNQLAVVEQGKVAVLDAATGQVLYQLAHEQYPAGPLSTAMSRDGNICAVGYHITVKAANRRIAQGDPHAADEYIEKSELKRAYKKYRRMDSASPGKISKLSNNRTIQALKTVMKRHQTTP